MICKNCGIEITQDNKYPSDFRYCSSCGAERRTYLYIEKYANFFTFNESRIENHPNKVSNKTNN